MRPPICANLPLESPEMKRNSVVTLAGALLIVGLNGAFSFGQVNQGVSTPAAQYFTARYNGGVQNQPIQQAPGLRGHAPAPQAVEITGSKPFQNIQHAPTLSPYLAMDLIESSTQLPNYQAFVQPQLQQRAANDAQAREIARLRQQVRVATSRGVVSRNPTPGVPTTGSSMQFMNMGSYFPGTNVR
jgi:hypothetical protein